MKIFQEVEWLKEHIESSNIRIVDCRFNLANEDEGRLLYEKNHIPGAVYLDLNKDLSSPLKEHGGRHPLPNPSIFKNKLEIIGIDQHSTVIAYDNREGAFASRLWWLLKYLGHENVFVLNGGFQEWMNKGYPINDKVPIYEKTSYHYVLNQDMLASLDEVKEIASGRSSVILVDSREERRYWGFEEPIDRIAGHIPGAVNKPWVDGMKNGRFKSISSQEKRFSDLKKDQSIIVYCGSGVTATVNYISLLVAGYSKVRLYAGSYSDWVSYEEHQVEKGETGS